MNKTEFKVAITDTRIGERTGRRIYEYLTAIYGPKTMDDDEWFDEKVSEILSGMDGGQGWTVLDLTSYQCYALLGAAIAHFEYDTELFFGVGSFSIIGHYIAHKFSLEGEE